MQRTARTAALAVLALLVAPGGLATTGTARAEVTAEQVRRAIDRGVDYLKSRQSPNGGWSPEHPGQPGGVTALVTLALLNSGVPADDPAIQRALDRLRTMEQPTMTYAASLQTMALSEAEPERDRLLIRRNVEWLESTQIRTGADRGGWGYGSGGRPDNSNTQFAMLALYEADRVGVRVREETWRMAYEYWTQRQRDDGAWSYRGDRGDHPDDPPTGSMTSAGIGSLVIASGRLSRSEAQVQDGQVRCCGDAETDDPVARGLAWLAAHFSVVRNPAPATRLGQVHSRAYMLYYLYGLERVGRLTAQRFIGQHDWYRLGAQELVQRQDALNGSWRGTGHAEGTELVGTSFALLFLSKGRRPTLISRAKHGRDEDWNTHRASLQNLTHYVERQWQQNLTWQTIDLRAAQVEDLLETPVLFISGRDRLQLSADEKENLREYIAQGGFIFAEACHGHGCDATAFDEDFRQLVSELFPDSRLRLLPSDHPIWYAEEAVDPHHMKPLYGLDACCRTSIVYSSQTLSCFWELAGDRQRQFPDEVQAEIDAALAIGRNVVAYATNRQLKEKLDRPRILDRTAADGLQRGAVTVAKLLHAGGSDDAPNALLNLTSLAGDELGMPIYAAGQLVAPSDLELLDFPVVFMHGRRHFSWSDVERQALATYLERGGTLLADSICASSEFSQSFRREVAALFPDAALERIPPEHPMLTSRYRGFDLSRVSLRDPQQRRDERDPLASRVVQTSPLLEGLTVNGRLAVVFSPYDMSCALENHPSLECKGYLQPDAARLGINILLYALQQ